MNEVAELRQAAAALRSRATRASTGEPWEADRRYGAAWDIDLKPSMGMVDSAQALAEAQLGIPECDDFENPRFLSAFVAHAIYIALMHPELGVAIADWLDYRAGYYESMRGQHDIATSGVMTEDPAFRVAKLINEGVTR